MVNQGSSVILLAEGKLLFRTYPPPPMCRVMGDTMQRLVSRSGASGGQQCDVARQWGCSPTHGTTLGTIAWGGSLVCNHASRVQGSEDTANIWRYSLSQNEFPRKHV
jgi:hypothetical protein